MRRPLIYALSMSERIEVASTDHQGTTSTGASPRPATLKIITNKPEYNGL